MVNSTIGKYKITRLIGEGGMACVYEAEHEMLGTKVAIKVLNPILSTNLQIKERFRNEAKLMGSLRHPNITRVIDFDEKPQRLSIIIEYLEGEDLNQKIKRDGPLSEKLFSEIFTQLLNALQYAHDKDIVHRDIKPSNIFIQPNGQVKILDFGIAKLFGHGNEMTLTGAQLGTPVYMSPEQVKADKSIDHRSDIYSLGVTMFYGIYGKPPYNTNTDSHFDIFNKIVYEPLPNLSAASKYYDIVLKACQKNRNERFQSCREMLHKFKLENLNPFIDEDKTLMNQLTNDKTSIHSNHANAIAGDPNPDTNSKKRRNLIFYVLTAISIIVLIFFIIMLSLGDDFSISFNENTKDTTPGNRLAVAKKYEYGDFVFVNKTSQTIKLVACYPGINWKMTPNDWVEIFPGESYDFHTSSGELYYHAYSDRDPNRIWLSLSDSTADYAYSDTTIYLDSKQFPTTSDNFKFFQSLGKLHNVRVTFIRVFPTIKFGNEWPITINLTHKKNGSKKRIMRALPQKHTIKKNQESRFE